MTAAANCEVKLHAFRRTADGTVVSFLIHPADTPDCLALDPLGQRYMLAIAAIGDDEQASSHEAGERPGAADRAHDAHQGEPSAEAGRSSERPPFTTAVVPERAENRDTFNPLKHYGRGYSDQSNMERARKRAVMLCKDERFRRWVYWPIRGDVGEEDAADFIRKQIGASRSEIATNYDVYLKFKALVGRYEVATGQIAERRG